MAGSISIWRVVGPGRRGAGELGSTIGSAEVAGILTDTIRIAVIMGMEAAKGDLVISMTQEKDKGEGMESATRIGAMMIVGIERSLNKGISMG